MLSRLGHILLVATSLAPIAIVYAFSKCPDQPAECIRWLAIAGALALVAHGVLTYIARHGESESVPIERIKSMDKEALSFLVAYALPLVVTTERSPNVWALAAFLVLIFMVLYQLQIAHVNPLLACLGYHFFEVTPKTGETVLLISRNRPAVGITRVVRLSNFIWLELRS